jgi:hypothetical protein
MAALKDIRVALATAISNATGIATYFYEPDAPVLPCAIVTPRSSDTLTFGRGNDQYEFIVKVIAGSTSEQIEQDWLDDAVTGAGSGSVRAAIYLAPTLGSGATESGAAAGTKYTATVGGIESYDRVSIENQGIHWFATLTVKVITPGSV